MFPDSKIAQSYSCGRTKTQAIIKQVIAPLLNDQVTVTCKTSHFSFLCDGDNDQDGKCFAIMGYNWSECEKQAVTHFLAMPMCNIATAESILQRQPDVFSLGCVCHLAALCATAGLKVLPICIN